MQNPETGNNGKKSATQSDYHIFATNSIILVHKTRIITEISYSRGQFNLHTQSSIYILNGFIYNNVQVI